MKRLITQYTPFVMAVLLLASILVIPAHADERGSVLDGNILVSDQLSSATVSSDVVTATAYGAKSASQTNNITLKNNYDGNIELTFKWSVQKKGYASISCTVGSTTVTKKGSGTHTVTLSKDASFTIELSATGAKFTDATATLTLSEFSYKTVADSYNVTVNTNGSGTVAVSGGTLVSGTTYSVSPTSGATFTATASSGYTFLGWRQDDTRLSTSTSYTVKPTVDMTIEAVFAKDTAWFIVDNKYLTNDLNKASKDLGTTIVLANNGTLASGSYTIQSGDTLLIPYDSSHTVVTTAEPPISSTDNYTTPTAYRTLTMASGASITLKGKLSVAGSLIAYQTTGYNGLPNGPTGQVNMNANSTITVENGAAMYAYGYIYGSGSVEVKSGGTVYECFQLRDFRGGDATSTIHGDREEKRLFPMMQYYVQNVQVPMKLNAGAIEKGISCFNLSYGIGYTQKYSEVPFIGGSGMFNITDGYIIKDYEETTDRLNIYVNGGLEVNNYNFSIDLSIINAITLASKDYIIPINHNITVDIQSGSLAINQDISLLPGAQIIVREGAQCTLGSGTEIILYDGSNWGRYIGEQYGNGETNTWLKPALYMAGGKIIDRRSVGEKNLADAAIVINGEVDASLGQIYTTTDGARITSDGDGVLKLGTPGTLTTAYQATQSGTSISYVTVALTPAQLLHANGTYLATADATGDPIFTYTYKSDFWHATGCDGNTETSETKATCTIDGSRVTKCKCEIIKTEETLPHPGHTEVTDAAVAATCTETGLTEGKHCSVCSEVLVAQEEVAALGHTFLEGGGPCSVCGKFEIFASSLQAGDSLKLYFYVEASRLEGELANYQAQIVRYRQGTADSTAVTIDGGQWSFFENGENDLYRFSYDGIAAKEMTDNLVVTVEKKNGEGWTAVTSPKTESVAGYAVRYLTKSLTNDVTDGSKDAALRTTLVDLLNYGAACQTNFDYNTDNLANKDIDDYQKYATGDDVTPDATERGEPTFFAGSTVSVENSLIYNIYAHEEAVNKTAVVTYKDHYGKDHTLTKVITQSDYNSTVGYYRIQVTDLAIADGRQEITCKLVDTDGTTVLETVTGSVQDYVATQWNAADTKLKAVVRTLMKFIDSAHTYFHYYDANTT